MEIIVSRFIALILGTTALIGGASVASAQSVGIYVGPSGFETSYYGYGTGYGERYRYRDSNRIYSNDGPRVYGYTRRYNDTDSSERGNVRRVPGGCGTYYFWDGDQCVDARYR
jgi:hypothetical protein